MGRGGRPWGRAKDRGHPPTPRSDLGQVPRGSRCAHGRVRTRGRIPAPSVRLLLSRGVAAPRSRSGPGGARRAPLGLGEPRLASPAPTPPGPAPTRRPAPPRHSPGPPTCGRDPLRRPPPRAAPARSLGPGSERMRGYLGAAAAAPAPEPPGPSASPPRPLLPGRARARPALDAVSAAARLPAAPLGSPSQAEPSPAGSGRGAQCGRGRRAVWSRRAWRRKRRRKEGKTPPPPRPGEPGARARRPRGTAPPAPRPAPRPR